jgi:hypothetical protein
MVATAFEFYLLSKSNNLHLTYQDFTLCGKVMSRTGLEPATRCQVVKSLMLGSRLGGPDWRWEISD